MNNNEEKLKSLREATGSDDLEFIGIDDSFGFDCKQCGKCCMNREDIILNPFDVYNGAKHLGIDVFEFIKRYTYSTLGSKSKIPMLLLKTSDNGFCPLLKFDIKDGGKFKCIIHEAKPNACANHPIGIIRDTKDKNVDFEFVKVSQCSNSVSDKQHIVRDWVKNYLEHKEEIYIAHKLQILIQEYYDSKYFYRFMNFSTNAYGKFSIDDYNKDSKDFIGMYVSKFLEIIYNYDINKPFIPQAEENLEKLKKFCEESKKTYDEFSKLFSDTFNCSFEETVDNMLSEEK